MSDVRTLSDAELMRALGGAGATSGGKPLMEVSTADGGRARVREDHWREPERAGLPVFGSRGTVERIAPRSEFQAVPEPASVPPVGSLSDEQLLAALGRAEPMAGEAGDEAGDERSGFLGTIDAGIRGAADTLTFGLADEFAAAMGALTGIDGTFGDYEGNLARQRGIDRADAEERPAARITGQLAGAVTGGVGLAKSGATLMRSGQSLPTAIAAGAAEGAAFGAAQGFGSGEGGFGERLESAGEGAMFGAAVGGAVPVAARGVGALTRAVMTGRQVDPAARMVLDDLAREGVTPPELGSRARAIGDDGMIADASETMRLRAEQIAHSDNPGRPVVIDALRQRAVRAEGRIRGAFDDAMGGTPNVRTTLDNLSSSKKALADELYGQARQVARPVNTTPLIEAIDRAIYTDADVAVQARSSPSPDALDREMQWLMGRLTGRGNATGTAGATQVVDFNRLHTLQRDIAEKARSYRNRGESYVASRLMTARGQLLAALDEATEQAPGDRSSSLYAAARRQFADDSAVEEAFETGRTIFAAKHHPDFITAQMDGMSSAERDAIELGVRTAIDEAMGRVRNGALKGRTLLDADFNERKVMAVLGPDRGRQLIAELLGEQEMAATANQVLGNSATARRMDNPFRATRGGENPVGVVRNLLNLKVGDAGARAWGYVSDWLGQRQAQALAERLGPILVAGGAQREEAIEALMKAADVLKRATAAGGRVEDRAREALRGLPLTAGGRRGDE